jgi:hypothetical protein
MGADYFSMTNQWNPFGNITTGMYPSTILPTANEVNIPNVPMYPVGNGIISSMPPTTYQRYSYSLEPEPFRNSGNYSYWSPSSFENTFQTFQTSASLIDRLFQYDPQPLDREDNRELDVKESVYAPPSGSAETGSAESQTCSICCVDLQQGNKIMKLSCNHVFHSECLKEWGKYKAECPNCRKNIPVKGINHSFGSREL